MATAGKKRLVFLGIATVLYRRKPAFLANAATRNAPGLSMVSRLADLLWHQSR
jgi:hypothetical protein